MKLLVLTRYGRLGASSRLRGLQFLPELEKSNIECVVAPLIEDKQLKARYDGGAYQPLRLFYSYWKRINVLIRRSSFDAIWIEKEALPWLPAWFELWLLCRIPYILDYDDAIFHNYDNHRSALVRRFFAQRIDQLMAEASLVVVGNEYLAERARRAKSARIEVIPTVIDLTRYVAKSPMTSIDNRLRIVWIGSPSTLRYLEILHEPLVALHRKFAFKLRVIGGDAVNLPGVDVELIPWNEATEMISIQACDIGVMPLVDSPWERGKCGYKLIQYMACGLPVVASSVGVNAEIVRAGENGFLADNSNEWINALEQLLSNANLRQKMGRAGRERVEAEYCIQQVGPKLTALLHSIADGN